MTGQGKQPDKTYWHIEYDDGNQEDSYVTSPSDVEIMRCRMAAPDASTTLTYGPNRIVIEAWGPLGRFR